MIKILRYKILFTLLLPALLLSAQVSFNGSTGVITDNQNWINFTCNVSGLNPANITGTYGFEKLTLNISHNNVSDLEIHLISPDGTDVLILNNVGGTGNNFTNTGFKKNYTTPIANGTAPFNGSYKPQGDLGLFNNGQPGNGSWTLRVRDNDAGFQGTVTGWQIRFGNAPAAPSIPFTTNLPIIKINTAGAGIPDDPKIPAWFQVINNTGGVNSPTDTTFEYQGVIGIEQRGSSSGSADKKSYGFETWDVNYNEIDTGILGMPAQSDWILSASYYDKTLMRNVLSYKLFNDMSHYASRTQYCEVFLNDEYKGIYIMMEKIKRDESRVDVAKLNNTDTTGDQLTGGYIVKIDKFTGSGGDGFYSNFQPSNPTGDVIYYQYEYPSPDSIMPQQESYIARYIDSFETALFGANYQDPVNGFRRYAGERTFMDYMFINELSKNVDGYRLSTYFYKDKYSKGGKIKAGPTWDYDIGWMNADYCQAEIDTGWAYNLNYVCTGAAVPAHWERMMSDPLFRQRVRCRWASLRQSILHTDTILAYIDSTVAYINAAQQRNFALWPILGQATWPQPQPIPQSYAAEIQRLKTWIINRTAWIDSKIYALPVLNLPVDLGADTGICAGNIVTLNGGQYDNYEWSNGLNAPIVNVSADGVYTLTVSDDFGCRGTDTIVLTVHTLPIVNLGSDTILCETDSITLNAGIYSSYVWSSSETTQQLIASQQGTYQVTVADSNNCTGTDDIQIAFTPLPIVNLGVDTTICQGNTLTLNAGIHDSYNWGTELTTQTISVNAAGTYSVTVTGSNCSAVDSLNVEIQPLPDAAFTAVAQGNSVYQFMGDTSGTYQHSWDYGNGIIGFEERPVYDYGNSNGTYQVIHTITDNSGCTSSDTVTVTVQAVGINTVDLYAINIYPNPNTNTLNINGGNIDIDKIEIVDILGQRVITVNKPGNISTINTSAYTAGTYIVHIYTGIGVYTAKVLKL